MASVVANVLGWRLLRRSPTSGLGWDNLPCQELRHGVLVRSPFLHLSSLNDQVFNIKSPSGSSGHLACLPLFMVRPTRGLWWLKAEVWVAGERFGSASATGIRLLFRAGIPTVLALWTCTSMGATGPLALFPPIPAR
ncbi:hypothetical protein VNO77_22526 [Canavalia gladiata]|uniref:Uncharacterized protein n=1 Tax=Canavalia gladiata TaxID=3824 RepID=A0AAN9L2S3_CANGL